MKVNSMYIACKQISHFPSEGTFSEYKLRSSAVLQCCWFKINQCGVLAHRSEEEGKLKAKKKKKKTKKPKESDSEESSSSQKVERKRKKKKQKEPEHNSNSDG